MSQRPILFLLKADFEDPSVASGSFYCPYCIRIEGMLATFPSLRAELDVRYVDFAKPRGQLPEYAGTDNQSCPQLILPNGDDEVSEQWSVPAAARAQRIEDTTGIQDYLSARYKLSRRHP
jgi:hypothetical protein